MPAIGMVNAFASAYLVIVDERPNVRDQNNINNTKNNFISKKKSSLFSYTYPSSHFFLHTE